MSAARKTAKSATIELPTGHNDRVLFLDNNSADFTAASELLTIAEVAQLLKISIPGVRRLQAGRHIPFLKIGGSIRFAKGDLIAYLEKCRVKAAEQ